LKSYGVPNRRFRQEDRIVDNAQISRPAPIWQDPRAVALLMAASLTTMANATISPALPGLERLFADDPNASMLTRLLVPAPSLSVALCAPFAGLAADRCGRDAGCFSPASSSS